MYRIFRGKHLLILAATDEDYSEFSPDFIVKKPSEEQILEILRISKSSTKALQILLIGRAKKNFKRIKAEFKLVEAAGGLVFNKKDEILAIKRLGKWDLPKGKLKKGESIEECAMREVEEETGASGLTIRYHLTETYHTYYRGSRWHLKKTYWYVMDCRKHKNLVPQLEEKIAEAKWFKFNKLNPQKLNTYPAIKWILKEYSEIKTADQSVDQ